MADNQSPTTQNSSDEIDLGQLFKLIGRGFNAVFRFFLRAFLYLKKNIFILIGLVVFGFALGYGLSKIISKKMKSEVIVKPQLESKNYLYDVIGEIQSNISAQDTLFFKNIGIEEIDFNGLEVDISRVIEEGNTESDLKYLELLQSFENTDAIADIVRAELQNKSSFNHRITFYYKNLEQGKVFANQVMNYINTNAYFGGMLKVYRNNAINRIEQNQTLLAQVDVIITNYTNNLASKKDNLVSNQIILDNQEQVSIAKLFELKNVLIRDIESKKLELEERSESVSIINFGQPQVVKNSFFGRNIVFIPLLLLSLFFLISLIRFLNKKTHELF
tara:strand:+ start:51 stop:1046 length:996 start_codon:yes stop_codon:yes gene_type:complete